MKTGAPVTDLITKGSDGKQLVTRQSNVPALRPVTRAALVVLVVGGVGLMVSGLWAFGVVVLLASGLGYVISLVRSAPTVSLDISLLDTPVIKDTRRQIGKARFLENIGNEGERLGDLGDGMIARWKAFEKLIAQKFEPTELTFQRYWGVAHLTLTSHFENLKMASDLLTQLSLAGQTGPGDLKRSIEERLALGDRTVGEFDKLCSELARLETGAGQSAASLEGTLAELGELATRAQKYSHSNINKLD